MNREFTRTVRSARDQGTNARLPPCRAGYRPSSCLACFAPARLALPIIRGIPHRTLKFSRLTTLRNRSTKYLLEIAFAVRMADEIKRPDIQCGEVVSVFVWTRRCANDDRGNFDRLALEMPHDIAIGPANQPKATKASGDTLLREHASDLVHSLCPDRPQRIILQQFAHAVADTRVNRRYQHSWLSKSWRNTFT
jgi:hypothetical protein